MVKQCFIIFLIATIFSHYSFAKGSLRGDNRKSVRQADLHDFTRVKTAGRLQWFIQNGRMVRLTGSPYYTVSRGVSFPYVRPEVQTFIERLSRQHFQHCREKIVVTSAFRPKNSRVNATPHSVHPTGMAIDISLPHSRKCRKWLNDTLLYLENHNVLEVAREYIRPHYHIAVFPRGYKQYLNDRYGLNKAKYKVQPSDSLWVIARRFDTTVAKLQKVNGIRNGDFIKPGQVLTLP
tara:strand:+ start:3667 stop:4371 length:705 start_codon:yes stop_codon:yes gene_type:complete